MGSVDLAVATNGRVSSMLDLRSYIFITLSCCMLDSCCSDKVRKKIHVDADLYERAENLVRRGKTLHATRMLACCHDL